MLLTVHGQADLPAVATLGTWDPFVADVRVLARSLALYAHGRGLAAVAVLLDPTPAAVLGGEHRWPYFHDAATRVALLREAGVDAVAVVHFERDDLSLGASDFFDVVGGGVTLAEFWLRGKQSVGSGPRGDVTAVRAQCARRGIRLRIVKELSKEVAAVGRRHLLAGEVRRAALVAGTLPTMRRPDSGAARVAWAPGTYRAVASEGPGLYESDGATGRPLTVTVVASPSGMTLLEWPDRRAAYLRFVAGPADAAAELPRPFGIAEQAAAPASVAVAGA